MHVNPESSRQWPRATSLAKTWDVRNEQKERCPVTCWGQKWPLLPSLRWGNPPSPAVLSSDAVKRRWSLSALSGVFVIQGSKVMIFQIPLTSCNLYNLTHAQLDTSAR